MNRIQVVSSSINSIGYNQADEILEVEFSRGAIYKYYDVPVKIYNDLIGAESIGRYFSKKIARVYRFEEMK